MKRPWKNFMFCVAILMLSNACTGGIEYGDSDRGVSPSSVVKFACQSPVQRASSGNFSAVGCASAGATGSQASSADAIASNPLQALGEALLGD